MSPPDEPAFLPPHDDERSAQALAGAAAGRAATRPFMPEQHRAFFALLAHVFVAVADPAGWPTATVLCGAAGFIGSPDATTLRIAALPPVDDPAAAGMVAGAAIGLLGLDFTTRRRNRANGDVAAVDRGLTVRVAQSFGNCAQYIQTRMPAPRAAASAELEPLDRIDRAAEALISAADTFFVASRARAGLAQGGLDISHRGGRPGFVRVDGSTLSVPDYRGNRCFNTLGNLLGDPRAGLLFMDFASGDVVQLQGRAQIDWQASNGPAGAERVWRVLVERGWRRRAALPFAWAFGDYAPSTLGTGLWDLSPWPRRGE